MILDFNQLYMRKITIFRFLVLLLFVSAPVFSWGQQDVLKKVQVAISTGNFESLSSFLHSNIELKTETEEGTYSKSQSVFILKDFFRKFPAKAFEYNHIGNSPSGAQYAIGTLVCVNGTFRVYVKLKAKDSTFVVDRLDFTKQ